MNFWFASTLVHRLQCSDTTTLYSIFSQLFLIASTHLNEIIIVSSCKSLLASSLLSTWSCEKKLSPSASSLTRGGTEAWTGKDAELPSLPELLANNTEVGTKAISDFCWGSLHRGWISCSCVFYFLLLISAGDIFPRKAGSDSLTQTHCSCINCIRCAWDSDKRKTKNRKPVRFWSGLGSFLSGLNRFGQKRAAQM